MDSQNWLLDKLKLPYKSMECQSLPLLNNQVLSLSYSVNNTLVMTLISKNIKSCINSLKIQNVKLDPVTLDLLPDFCMLSEFYQPYKDKILKFKNQFEHFSISDVECMITATSNTQQYLEGQFIVFFRMVGPLNDKTIVSVSLDLFKDSIVFKNRLSEYKTTYEKINDVTFDSDFRQYYTDFIYDFYAKDINRIINILEKTVTKQEIYDNLKFYLELYSMIKI